MMQEYLLIISYGLYSKGQNECSFQDTSDRLVNLSATFILLLLYFGVYQQLNAPPQYISLDYVCLQAQNIYQRAVRVNQTLKFSIAGASCQPSNHNKTFL